MERDTNGRSDPTRLDRIERIVEVLANTQSDMQHELIILARSQVAMGETMTNMGKAIAELAEAQKHADQSMNALILTVDEIIRGRKPQ